MIEAVTFDWGQTLVQFEWDDGLLAAGHRAGLEALGRGAEADAFTRRFRDELLPGFVRGADYEALLRDELGLDDGALRAYLAAEHRVWEPNIALLGSAHALLEALRARGVRLGVVANHWPEPAWIVRDEIERLGVAARVDAVVLAGEVGARKPDPAIFERALAELGVDATAVLHVGDRLEEDVAGAAALGMTTAQALWFDADDTPAGVEPDYLAFTPMDVLNAVRRLAP
ncbi:MAG TPA: HAD family hydrolase [Gaiellaceae bacterium]|jgi:putative hydrolase of the HAD superfamily|nr:HAD family hydrolase [Gaiellaceae bacterium]